MSIGERIREERLVRKWSKEQLAEKAGFSRNSIINWETGARSPQQRVVVRLAEVFGISVVDMWGSSAERPHLRTFRETPDGSLVPVEVSGDPLQDVLSENPDLEVWFRTRKISDDDKAAIADLLRRIKDFWEGQEG